MIFSNSAGDDNYEFALKPETTAPTSIKLARQRRTQSDWRTLIIPWDASGQTQKAFCEAQGLCYRNFNQWKSRLKRQSSSMPDDALVSNFIALSVTGESSTMKPLNVRLSLDLPYNIQATLESDATSVASVTKALSSAPSC
ncbi:IS66 family insertion sequence element accessory protein TnpA [Teredinibacter haidensis]|uniref:IS66 family insertion sequence element accessory protein TnpA n=1 Tax=Teredinibacter haidensis TaxID=2731755 RepID=UPI003CCCEEF7